MGCHPLLQGIFLTQGWTWVSRIVGSFVTIWASEALTFSTLLLLLFVSKFFFPFSCVMLGILWYPFHYIIHLFLPILVKCPLTSSWLINLHCMSTSWKPSPVVLSIPFWSEGSEVQPVQFHTAVPLICCLLSNPFNTMWGNSLLSLLLPSRFSRVRLCATPWTAAYQPSPSMGFSRQEHWSRLPFPSPTSCLYVNIILFFKNVFFKKKQIFFH